jgi:AcrR family transcriptional regulator
MPNLPGRPKKTKSATATRSRILDVAESLFGYYGPDAVSIRDISRRAHVDSALVHYYFENKELLFEAVFERKAVILRDRLMRSLDAYVTSSSTNGENLEALIDAFVAPLLGSLEEDNAKWHYYFQLLVCLWSNPRRNGVRMIARSLGAIHDRLALLLKAVFSNAADEELEWHCTMLYVERRCATGA